MNRKFWIIIYLAVLTVDLFAVYSNNEAIRYVSKPLLMPLLIVCFIASAKPISSSLVRFIILALVFSWLGDVLLMFESINKNFFILGLIAFLIAHIFYILFYEFVARCENIRKNYWVFI